MKGGYIHPITIRRSTGKKISSNERRRRRLTTKIQTANKRNVRVRVNKRTRRTQFERR